MLFDYIILPYLLPSKLIKTIKIIQTINIIIVAVNLISYLN